MTEKNNFQKENEVLRNKLSVYEKGLFEASQQIEEKVQELSVLRRVVDIAGRVFEMDLFYRSFIDILLEETNAMNCSLMLLDESTNMLFLKIARGRNDDGSFFDYPVESDTRFSIGEGVAGSVALNRETILINETSRDNRFLMRETSFEIGSMLCSPLVFQKKLLGVVNISHAQAQNFDENSVRLMEILCGFVSTIIGNAEVHIRNVERFRSIFEGIRLAIIIIDKPNNTILDCNKYTESCFGYLKEEFLQMESIVDIVHTEYKEKMCEILTDYVENDNFIFYEIPFMQKDGSQKICEINVATVNYLDKDVIRLTLSDISEKKRLTEQLFQAEKLRSLGELAGGVAHDFNNVLAAILGRAQLLRAGIELLADKNEKTHAAELDLDKNLDIIEKAAIDGAETVRRIQEFSKDRDDSKYVVLVDLNQVIEDALAITRVRWKDIIESKGYEMNIIREFNAEQAVSGSASELREVFINLINNAADAMPNGGNLFIKTYDSDGFVFADFKDSGSGISEEHRKNIFDPFFTTKDVGSTGLGLSVSYGIIARHKGQITVENCDDGAVFKINLPASKTKIQDEKKCSVVLEKKKALILVIDDEKEVREVLSEMLVFSGHKVITAENGYEGVQKFKENDFSLVMTDLGMRGLSGFDVAKEIKNISKKIPVIMITGWQLNLTCEELKKKGVDCLLGKPFQIQQVLNSIQKNLID